MIDLQIAATNFRLAALAQWPHKHLTLLIKHGAPSRIPARLHLRFQVDALGERGGLQPLNH